jgi:hypothetical protein
MQNISVDEIIKMTSSNQIFNRRTPQNYSGVIPFNRFP